MNDEHIIIIMDNYASTKGHLLINTKRTIHYFFQFNIVSSVQA